MTAAERAHHLAESAVGAAGQGDSPDGRDAAMRYASVLATAAVAHALLALFELAQPLDASELDEEGGDDPKLPRDAWAGGFADNH